VTRLLKKITQCLEKVAKTVTVPETSVLKLNLKAQKSLKKLLKPKDTFNKQCFELLV
jgi:hypothetical protein